ncbi:hypothetical protein Ga0061079_103115 [Apibacter mensalis]|uniref:Uncharacterized protein n=1 Tax=Apibacter mensalis TaxID=1586267 RepID=A0A0X3AP28_9FLAO|nr:hypothetical protein [Apibacter mensalis]CVK15805.1 hypothetical protein Ga0061079_103115 [Apibacter mensalis]
MVYNCVIFTIYLGFNKGKDHKETPAHILIFTITALLGYVCVNVLVYRSPILSNILGMSAKYWKNIYPSVIW